MKLKIKSTVWQILAASTFAVGLLYSLGIEGTAQVGGTISDGQFVTALCLILTSGLFMRLAFAAEAREKAARRRYGRINRKHARNPEYPENQERDA